MSIQFKSLEIIPTTFLSIDTVGIQWSIKKTLEPPSQFQFFVERSGAPNGPFKEIAGPLDNTSFIDTTVNRFSKNREIFYRVKVVDKITLEESLTTDSDAAPFVSDWDEDRNRGAVSAFEEFVSGALSIHFAREDLVRMEIIRRNNLLLRRFTGTITAILKMRTFGQRCDKCWDPILRRSVTSFCPNCWGTGFTGGYFDQIDQFVDFDIEPKITRIEVRGEIQDIDDNANTTNFPLLSPGDLLVRPDGRRWTVISVQATELRRMVSRQLLALRLVNPNERNVYKVPVARPVAPDTEFIGFKPKGGSGLL